MQIANREEYKELQISALGLSPEAFSSLVRAGINTLYLLIENAGQLEALQNMSAASIAEIEELLCAVEAEGSDIDAFEQSPEYGKRELDIATVKKLREHYGFKTAWLCQWYDLSMQCVYQKLSKRINRGQWCGKELLADERSCITQMINTECFYKETERKNIT